MGDHQHYDGKDGMDFNWNAPEAATDMTISVMDENGKIVANFKVPGGCEAVTVQLLWCQYDK